MENNKRPLFTDAREQRSEPYVNPCIAKLSRSILQEKVRCWLCFVLKACLHILCAKTHTDNRCKPLCPLDAQLLEHIWDVAGDFVNDNTLTVYIKRLREKLEADPQTPCIIKTVRGVGYKID